MTELEEFIDSLDLIYSTRFVPQSKSRNASETEPTLNWSVSIGRAGDETLRCEYMQGIGHVPGYVHSYVKGGDAARVRGMQRVAAETGRYPIGYEGEFSETPPTLAALPKPELADVLHSLVLDTEVLNHADFESWAVEFGHSPDSRKAEAIFRRALEQSLRLRAIIGIGRLDKLTELFQDY